MRTTVKVARNLGFLNTTEVSILVEYTIQDTQRGSL
jgi:hypothetical protein